MLAYKFLIVILKHFLKATKNSLNSFTQLHLKTKINSLIANFHSKMLAKSFPCRIHQNGMELLRPNLAIKKWMSD